MPILCLPVLYDSSLKGCMGQEKEVYGPRVVCIWAQNHQSSLKGYSKMTPSETVGVENGWGM